MKKHSQAAYSSKIIIAILFFVFGSLAFWWYASGLGKQIVQKQQTSSAGKIIAGSFDQTKLKSDAEWKKILTPQQYYILRQQGRKYPLPDRYYIIRKKGHM